MPPASRAGRIRAAHVASSSSRVLGLPQPQVADRLPRQVLGLRVLVVGLGDAPGDAALEQRVASRRPRRMPELHRVGRSARGKRVEEPREQVGVVVQARRALEQHASEAVREQPARRHEPSDVLLHVLEPLPVGDPLVGLQREHEARASSLAPPLDRLLGGEPAERVVDLDRGQLRGVVVEHVVLLEALGVEDPMAPLVVCEPRGAQIEATGHLHIHEGTHP